MYVHLVRDNVCTYTQHSEVYVHLPGSPADVFSRAEMLVWKREEKHPFCWSFFCISGRPLGGQRPAAQPHVLSLGLGRTKYKGQKKEATGVSSKRAKKDLVASAISALLKTFSPKCSYVHLSDPFTFSSAMIRSQKKRKKDKKRTRNYQLAQLSRECRRRGKEVREEVEMHADLAENLLFLGES